MKILTLLIIVIMYYILRSKVSKKTYDNLVAPFFYLILMFTFSVVIFLLLYYSLKLTSIIGEESRFIILISMSGIWCLGMLMIGKNTILDVITILDYYVHKKEAFINGYIDNGEIIDIRCERKLGSYEKYQLIVNYNGKKLRSIYFRDNIYEIGKNIEVLVYKSHNYVVLSTEK